MEKKKLDILVGVVLVLGMTIALIIVVNTVGESKKVVPFETGEYCMDDEDTCIYFGDDYHFSYFSVGAGNPIDDTDLCESYTYLEKNNQIKIKCTDGKKDMLYDIYKYDDNSITLKIDETNITFNKSAK